MPLPEHNLERELALISLAIDLQQHPEKAVTLALNHYEDYMSLLDDYKRLQKYYEVLQMENIRLKSALDNRISPRLPSFLTRLNRH